MKCPLAAPPTDLINLDRSVVGGRHRLLVPLRLVCDGERESDFSVNSPVCSRSAGQCGKVRKGDRERAGEGGSEGGWRDFEIY